MVERTSSAIQRLERNTRFLLPMIDDIDVACSCSPFKTRSSLEYVWLLSSAVLLSESGTILSCFIFLTQHLFMIYLGHL